MPHIREDGGEKALRQGQCRSSNTTIILIVDIYYKYICQLKYRVVTYVWKWDWLVIVLAEIVKHVLNGNRHLCHGHGDRELLGNGSSVDVGHTASQMMVVYILVWKWEREECVIKSREADRPRGARQPTLHKSVHGHTPIKMNENRIQYDTCAEEMRVLLCIYYNTFFYKKNRIA